jgi:hypothetical protein
MMTKWMNRLVASGLAAVAGLLQPGAAHADDPAGMLSVASNLRPVVLPSLVWAFNGTGDATFYSSGSPLVVTSLGARVGVPPIPLWSGLELGANVASFVDSPSPPAFAYTPDVELTQRFLPWVQKPVQRESTEAFELALRLRGARDPSTLDFLGNVEAPLVFRAPDVLRVNVVPSVGYLAVVNRGEFAVSLFASFQVARTVWVGPKTSFFVPDMTQWGKPEIPLGAELGVTVPSAIGPLLDVVVDGRFPRLFVPGNSADSTDTHTFQAVLTLRLYTYWILNATFPPPQPPDPRQVQRCGGTP